MNLMKVYNLLPIQLQNLAASIEGYRIQRRRFNKEFWRTYREFENRNNWTYEQLCELRDKKVREIVKYCYKYVPYYTKLFNDYGINYESIRTIDDLKVVPILTKDTVKKHQKDLISTEYKGNVLKLNTSGTSGTGLQIYCTPQTIYEQFAVFWRARKNLGIDFNEWSGTFGGKSIVPIGQLKPPFWRINYPGKQVYFSVYHINENNIEAYLSEIERRKLKWIHSYPSALSLLANYMNSRGRKLSYSIEYLTTGSENLMPSQIDSIEKAFGAKPYQHYGQAENVAIFSQRKDYKIFVDEDFSAVEFIKSTSSENEYSIVGTTFNNYVMPLLRYEIGDIASHRETNEGREILSIDGRKEDYIILSNGNKIGRLPHVFSEMMNILEAQIIQEKIGELTIKIVKGPNYGAEDERALLSRMKSKIGESENIIIRYVDEIPKTKNGKLRFINSKIKNKP